MANNNFVVKNGLTVNGSFTANSTVVNTAAIIATSVNATSVNTATANATISIVVGANVTVNTSTILVGNSSVNTNITPNQVTLSGVTVNSTIYQGTANNATYLGTVPAASYVNTSGNYTITGNLNFTGTNTNFLTVYAGANSLINTSSYFVGNSIVNTSVTAGQISVSGVTVNSTIYQGTALTANNATYLGTVPAASYVNTSGNYTVAGNLNFTGTNNYFSALYAGANVTINTSRLFVGNSTVNTSITGGQISLSGVTVNSTIYQGTANNANNLNGQSASYYTDIVGRLTYTPANKAGDTFTGDIITNGSLRSQLSGGTTGQVVLGSGSYRLYQSGGNFDLNGNLNSSGYEFRVGDGTSGEKRYRLWNAARTVYFALGDSGAVNLWDVNDGVSGYNRWSTDTSGNFTVRNNVYASAFVADTNHPYYMRNDGAVSMYWDGTYIRFNQPVYMSSSLLTGSSITAGGGYVYIPEATGGGYGRAVHNNSGTIGFLSSSNGWIFRVDDSGNATASGNVTAYSDIKLKTNIRTITDALNKVKKLRGVSYQRISDMSDNIGVIAQEVQEVIPEVIHKDSSDTMSVAYGNLVGVLIEAIKELSAEVDALKNSTCKCTSETQQ